MVANPAESFALGKEIARTAPRLPKMGEPGFLGAHRPDTMTAYGVSPNTDEQNAAFRRVEHERIEALPDDDYRQSLIRIFGKNKPADFQHQHAAIDAALVLAARDGRGRDTDHILSVAADEYVSLRTELPDFLEGQQAKMDAKQEALEPKRKPNRATFSQPVTVPPPAPVAPPQSDAERDAETEAFFAGAGEVPPTPEEAVADAVLGTTLREDWSQRMTDMYGPDATAEFARATGYKSWKDAQVKGTLTDSEIGGLLNKHVIEHPVSLNVLRGNPPATTAATKPAANVPAHVDTPAPVADVPEAVKEPASVPQLPQSEAVATEHETITTPVYKEWPFVALLTLYSPEGLEMKYTIRAASDAALFDAERAFVARRLAAGFTTHRVAVTPVAAPVQVQQPAPLTYVPLPETVPPPAQPAPVATAPSGEVETEEVILVMPVMSKKGKREYELYIRLGNGEPSDFPRIKLRNDNDVAQLRAAVPTVDALDLGIKHPASFKVTYKQGKEYSPGKFYRDLVSISL